MANNAKLWAVLVGVDFYTNPQHRLRGCVQDIEDINAFLEIRYSNVEIIRLTASTPDDATPTRPSEQFSVLPTCANVTSALMKISETAAKGDYVYLHYSGHGTKCSTTSEYSNFSTEDAALVLYDPDTKSRYLRGIDLSRMLEMMAAKGLITTVVLDCCHSGSVTRHIDQESVRVRGIQWDSAVAAVDARPIKFARNARNANVSRHWLLDPQGYTLLAACGPHELASEHRFEDGKVHGVLTYWMVYALSTLIKGASELTYRSLHEFIRSKLNAKWPHQNPMRFGMGDSPFLGVKKLKQMSFAHVTDSLGHGRVRLNVGRAHGVCIDDEYAVYPLSPEIDKENSGSEEPPIVKIDTVTALTSTATAISDISTSTNIEVGWHAKPLTHFSIASALVKVPDDFGIDENLRTGIEDMTWLRLTSGCGKDETASFIIATNSGHEYQVFDATNQPVEKVPTVPSSNDNAKHQVLAIVEHLAKFKFVEGLENRNPVLGFDNSFTIEN